MLVWNAMPSMVPMMSLIFLDDALMSCIVSITSEITAPPRAADSELPEATCAASRTLSAVFLTVDEISSIDEALCSRLAAVCSVRADRSRDAEQTAARSEEH